MIKVEGTVKKITLDKEAKILIETPLLQDEIAFEELVNQKVSLQLTEEQGNFFKKGKKE